MPPGPPPNPAAARPKTVAWAARAPGAAGTVTGVAAAATQLEVVGSSDSDRGP
jgi:hypothetical protein